MRWVAYLVKLPVVNRLAVEVDRYNSVIEIPDTRLWKVGSDLFGEIREEQEKSKKAKYLKERKSSLKAVLDSSQVEGQ